MRTFQISPKMSTMQGVFYPTGYAFLMFPDAQEAENAARKLEESGFGEQDIMLLTPDVILREIGNIDGESSVALPSVGTEGATASDQAELKAFRLLPFTRASATHASCDQATV